MTNKKILVAEDDLEILRSIEIYLKGQGYDVIKAQNGKEAIEVFEEEGADLIIMDLMMPKLTGEEAILKIRESSYVPIIILSAKAEDFDKIVGLNIGADDYITKPFNPIELVARVNSAIRRYYKYIEEAEAQETILEDKIEIGSATLNMLEKNIVVSGDTIALTSIEYKILKLLMKNPGQIFSIE